MVQCCAFGCTNPGKYYFPKNAKLRKQWVVAVKREGFQPTQHSRLCFSHFLPQDFMLKEGFYSGLKKTGLKELAVPSVFSFKKPESAVATTRKERAQRRDTKRQLFVPVESMGAKAVGDVFSVDFENENTENAEETITSETQCTDAALLASTVPQVDTKVLCVSTQKDFQFFNVELFRNDNCGVHYYTGLETFEKFHFVLNTWCPEAYNLKYRYSQVLNLSVEDQFLLTLMKLRKNKDDYELTRFFNVSAVTVSNVFVTWINFMYQMWTQLNIWPSRGLVDFVMPEGFRKYYPTTRVIVDCTEVPIQKPKNPSAQQAVFSHYKNRCTCKFEVGATPSGLLCHCSFGYGGSASDRQILERNGLLDKCEEGDSVMADRGLNVQDLFAPKGVAVNIPEFLKGKSQLPGLTVLQDRKLASKRVHIERLIGLLKTYEILQTPVNSFYVPLTSKIFFVCSMLINFREGIVSKKA